jgi:hypothetical protein
MKTTWNVLVIKHNIGKLHQTEHIPSLLIKNEKVKDPGTTANAFNTFI